MASTNQQLASLVANLTANSAGNITGANIANYTGNLVTLIGNNGTSVQSVGIKTSTDANFSANYTLTLPVDDGTSGQFLTTDGSGVLSWAGGGNISSISNGTSNVNIAASNGPITAGANGLANIVVVDSNGTAGNVTFNSVINANGNINANVIQNSTSNITLSSTSVTMGTNSRTLVSVRSGFPTYQGVLTLVNTAAASNTVYSSVAYGNGIFAMVGPNNIVATSDAIGTTWTTTALPAGPTAYTSIAYGNGTWIAVGNSSANCAISSDNGATWSTGTLPSAANRGLVVYGNGVFAAFQNGSTSYLTSTDNGSTWTPRTGSWTLTGPWSSGLYGNGVFVVTANTNGGATGGIITSSDDGTTWTQRLGGDYRTVAYGNGMYIATSTTGISPYRSTNGGVTWTVASTSQALPYGYSAINYANGYFVGFQYSSQTGSVSFPTPTTVVISADGYNWTTQNLGGTVPENAPLAVASGNTTAGNKIIYVMGVPVSPNTLLNYNRCITLSIGSNNTLTTVGSDIGGTVSGTFSTGSVANVGTSGNRLLSGYDNAILSSYYTRTLAQPDPAGSGSYIRSAAIGQSLSADTMISIYSTGIATRYNTVTRQQYYTTALPTPGSGTAYAYIATDGVSTNSRFVAINNTGRTVYTISATPANAGETWTAGNTTDFAGGPYTWAAFIHGDGVYVAVPDSGTTYFTSTDGVTWTSRTFPVAFSTPLAAGYSPIGSPTTGAIAIVNSGTTTVYISTDSGVNWTSTTCPKSVSFLNAVNSRFITDITATQYAVMAAPTGAQTWALGTCSVSESTAVTQIGYYSTTSMYVATTGFGGTSQTLNYYVSSNLTDWTLYTLTKVNTFGVGNWVVRFVQNNRGVVIAVPNASAAASPEIYQIVVDSARSVVNAQQTLQISNVSNLKFTQFVPSIYNQRTGAYLTVTNGGNVELTTPTAWANAANISPGEMFIGDNAGYAVNIANIEVLGSGATGGIKVTTSTPHALYGSLSPFVISGVTGTGNYAALNGNVFTANIQAAGGYAANTTVFQLLWANGANVNVATWSGTYTTGTGNINLTAGSITTASPNVTGTGGLNSTQTPIGMYKCVGAISTTQSMWTRYD